MMNAKAEELGLTQMQFYNESGLDIESSTSGDLPQNGSSARASATAGGYGSAHDVASLFSKLWRKYPAAVEITAMPAARIVSQDNIVHVLPNTDGAIGKFSGLIASKTGYTTLAGGTLAIIFDRGISDPVVAVVLGSSQQGRFDDMAKLVAAAQK
jgi:D-alanyl-D-alanine carboxypeptidase